MSLSFGYDTGGGEPSRAPGPDSDVRRAREAQSLAKRPPAIAERAARKAARILYRVAGIEDEPRPNPYREAHHRTRSVFIHVPKTAGNSVARMLYSVPSSHLSGHTPARNFRDYSPGLYANYLVFATVRHPWDRLHSAYRYLKAGGMTPADRRWAARHLSAFDNFGAFVRASQDGALRQALFSGVHFRPQTDFLCDAEGRPIVDTLVRVDDFASGMGAVCRRLSLDFAPVHLNAAPPGTDAAAEAPPELERICFSLYARDYEVLGYRPHSA